MPAFSSLPGADHTILLDFDGQTVENTSWNNYYNQTSLVAQPYDLDGNPGTFNSTELARIEEAWKRTAEDFRPFNVNVTTVDPGVEALRKSGTGDTQWGIRVIVTKESTMVNDPGEYCGCGGIAYINSFNWSSDTPVWVYTTGGKSIAEAASHEVGHSLGLSHDGLISGTTYYQGHGSGATGWAPIMGVGYYENVTQWDKGEYYNSNNGGSGANYGDGPDDLALIVTGNGFGHRTDDHADTNVGASALGLAGTTVADGGIIERTNDIDVFTFTTGTGLVTLDIDPFTPGPNLDIKAELYDSGGGLVATSNSDSVLDASFSLSLSAGQYYLHVDGTGWGAPTANPPTGYTDYASLGQYSISGAIVDPGGLPAVSISDASASEGAGNITFTLTLSDAAAEETSVNWATADGSATAGFDYQANSGTVTFSPGQTTADVTINLLDDSDYEGNETLVVNLTNPNGLSISDSQGIGTIVENDPAPLPSVSISDASVNEGKEFTNGKKAGTRQRTDMIFTITLSSASAQSVSVSYATTGGTATAGEDYETAGDVVTFSPGETSKTIAVTVLGDNLTEGNETITVDLSAPTNAALGDANATGTIIDDDSGGGGGGGGNGKGGGRNKAPRDSEQAPQVIADPFWFFEGPGFHDHGHDEHAHHHDFHDIHQELLGGAGRLSPALADLLDPIAETISLNNPTTLRLTDVQATDPIPTDAATSASFTASDSSPSRHLDDRFENEPILDESLLEALATALLRA